MTDPLLDRVRERIAILHASSAWGSDDAMLMEALLRRIEGEYICRCGLRVEPHRCADQKGEF